MLIFSTVLYLFIRSMRIGKILVDSDSETHDAQVVFAKFPDDIANRFVLYYSCKNFCHLLAILSWKKIDFFLFLLSQSSCWKKNVFYTSRKVLLLYPIMSSGNKVCKAIQVLKDHEVPEVRKIEDQTARKFRSGWHYNFLGSSGCSHFCPIFWT